MVVSSHDDRARRRATRRALRRLAPLLVLWLAGPAGSAAPPAEDLGLSWSADVVSSNFRNDTIELSGNVRVTQGPMSIEAGTATATDASSNRSRWTFREAVHIRTLEADLRSQLASAAFVNGQIAGARVEGDPAQFEQRSGPSDGQVRGRAGVVEYDFAAGVVTLSDQVWFSNGKDEFRGDVVIYNVRDERVQINPDGKSPGGVRGIIRPRERSKGALDVRPQPPRAGEPEGAPATENGA